VKNLRNFGHHLALVVFDLGEETPLLNILGAIPNFRDDL